MHVIGSGLTQESMFFCVSMTYGTQYNDTDNKP
jgi:hypothetical protein